MNRSNFILLIHLNFNDISKYSEQLLVRKPFQRINRSASKMFAVVTLEVSKTKSVVPIHWIGQLNLSAHANYGVNSSVKHVVFYSENRTKQANFNMTLSNNIEGGTDACYFARINKYFGKFIMIEETKIS